jgi:hypothetical protein
VTSGFMSGYRAFIHPLSTPKNRAKAQVGRFYTHARGIRTDLCLATDDSYRPNSLRPCIARCLTYKLNCSLKWT